MEMVEVYDEKIQRYLEKDSEVESLLENKLWTFDIVISRLQSFLNHSKTIILFFTIFLVIYYIYITFISYIFF